MSSPKSSNPPLTLESIESALNQIDAKKQSLKKAFEELQSQTSLTSSLSLSWPDLDAHFTSVQRSLTHQFRLLQSLENPQTASASSDSKTDPKSGDPFGSKVCLDGKDSVLSRVDPVESKADPKNGDPFGANVSGDGKESVLSRVDPNSGDKGGDFIRVELRSLCERMDGNGLREYINKGWDVRDKIRVELVDAMECASDPALLVLDSIERFYGKGKMGKGSSGRSCEMLLEALVEVRSVEVSDEVRERAKELVSDWRKKEVKKRGLKFHLLGLLKLIGAFRLTSELSLEEFIDHLIDAKPRQASKLCLLLGFGDKIIDIIQKLLSKNVIILALELVYDFELTDKFPPVPILHSYVSKSRKRAKKVCEDGNNARWAEKAAISLEVSALKAVAKFIGTHNLDSEFPRADLEKLIEQLEEQMADKKRPAAAPASKSQQLRQPTKQQQQPPQSGNKRSRMKSTIEPREVLPLHQSFLGSAGLLPDRHAPSLSSPDVLYGLAGSAPSVVPLTGTSAGLYGSARTSAGIYGSAETSVRVYGSPDVPYGLAGSAPGVVPLTGTSVGHYGSARTSAGVYGSAGIPAGIYGNQIPASSQLHSSESHIPSGYYDRQTAYSGYTAPPQYYLPKFRR